MKRLFHVVSAILLTLFGASGCTYYMPAAVSSSSVGNKGEIPVKVVSGLSRASYFLFFGPFGDDSLQAALEDARHGGNGDTLANVFVDRKLFCVPLCEFPLYKSVETKITGTLVKYQDERSSQFQKAPEVVPPIPTRSKTDISAETAYSQLFAAFNDDDEVAAQAVYNAFSGETQNALRQYVFTTRGKGTAWSWKFTIAANMLENEKRFLRWYVRSCTDYKPNE